MRFLNIAAASLTRLTSLTTLADRGRRPAVHRAQVIRILAFWVLIAATLVLMQRQQTHAAERGTPAVAGSASSASLLGAGVQGPGVRDIGS